MATTPDVTLAPGADENGLANMLAGLVTQNLQSKPKKLDDFAALDGRIAVVADDADVALTLEFRAGGKLVIHDGIVGIPDLTIRGPSDTIIALSNLPMATPLGLPIPRPSDREAVGAVRTVVGALRHRTLRIHGALLHLPLFLKLGHVLSVNG
jgi:hypothetical protein